MVSYVFNKNHIQILGTDEPVQMGPDQGLTRVRAPVAEQTQLDVLDLDRLLEQGVVWQVQHAGAKVQGGAPVGIDGLELLRYCARPPVRPGADSARRLRRSSTFEIPMLRTISSSVRWYSRYIFSRSFA